MKLTWKNKGGTTKGFLVAYAEGTRGPEYCTEGVRPKMEDPLAQELVVDGLQANTNYTFRICSFNGNPSPIKSQGILLTKKTLQYPPDPATNVNKKNVTATSATIVWTRGEKNVAGHIIRYQEGNTPPADCASGTEVSSRTITAASAGVSGLLPAKTYAFLVCSFNTNPTPDLTPGGFTVVNTEQPPPPNPIEPTIIQRELNSLTVSWQSAGGSTHSYKGVVYPSGSSVNDGLRCEITGNTVKSISNSAIELDVLINGVRKNRASVTGLNPGTSYVIRICAVNQNPNPDVSAGAVTAAVKTLDNPPNDPKGAVTVLPLSRTQVNLSWSAPDPQPGTSAGGYTIAYQASQAQAPANCLPAPGVTIIPSFAISQTSHVVENLNSNTTYFFRVCTVNGNPIPDLSAGKTGSGTTWQDPPNELTNLAVTQLWDVSVGLSWTSGGGTTSGYLGSYLVGTNPPANCSAGLNIPNFSASSSITVSGLQPNTEYSFRICAKNANETPDYSPGITLNIKTLVGPPTNIVVSPAVQGAVLSWNAVSGATGYVVYYSKTSPVVKSSATAFHVTENAANITGLDVKAIYFFAVASKQVAFETPLSAGVYSIETAGPVPTTPTQFFASAAPASKISASFVAPQNTIVVNYRAYYSTSPGVSKSSSYVTFSGPGSYFAPTGGFMNNTIYYVAVSALDVFGQESGLTNERKVKTSRFVTFPQNSPGFNYLAARVVNQFVVSAPYFFAATDGGGVSVSEDSGLTWSNRTTANGLGDNRVTSIAYASGTLIAGTKGGLSWSSDVGASWTNETTAQGLPSNNISAVHVSDGLIYAATDAGLAVRTLSGGSWAVYNSTNTSGGIASNDTRSVWANGSVIYLATSAGLAMSTNGGGNFTTVTTGAGLGSNTINVVFSDGSKIYAGTSNGLSVSTNAGASFVNSTTGLNTSTNITGIAVNGTNIYVGTSAGLGISTNGGSSFTLQDTANGLASVILKSVAIYAGTIYASTASGVSYSSDGANIWRTYATLNGITSDDVRGVAEASGTLYLATKSGISLSRNGGVTWIPKLPSVAFNRVFALGNNVFAPSENNGIARSADAGLTWNWVNTSNGLPHNKVWGMFFDGTTIYAGTNSGIAKSNDNGNTYTLFANTSHGLADNLTNDLFIEGNNLWAATYSGLSYANISNTNNILFKTLSLPRPADGKNFHYFPSDSDQHPHTPFVGQFTGIAKSGQILIATWKSGASQGGVFISRDGGTSWEHQDASSSTGIQNSAMNGVYIYDSKIYLASDGGIHVSSNNGVSWQNYSTGAGICAMIVQKVFVNATGVYAACYTGGLSISNDGLQSFKNRSRESGFGFDPGTNIGNPNQVRRTYATGSYIYAATAGGLLVSTDNGLSWNNRKESGTNNIGSYDIKDVWVTDGRVVTATNSGASISTDLKANFWALYSSAMGLTSSAANGVAGAGSKVYVATNSGLSFSSNVGQGWVGRNLTSAPTLPTNSVSKAFAIGNTLHIATANGYAYSQNDGANWTVRNTTHGLATNTENSVTADAQGIVYLATNSGLAISTNADLTSFVNKTTAQGLPSNKINDVAVNGSTVYAATDLGLAISTDGGNTFSTILTTAIGLGTNQVNSVFFSAEGVLYLGTEGGGLAVGLP